MDDSLFEAISELLNEYLEDESIEEDAMIKVLQRWIHENEDLTGTGLQDIEDEDDEEVEG